MTIDKKPEQNNKSARDIMNELDDLLSAEARLSLTNADQLIQALETGKIGSFEAHSPYAACLVPALLALGWRGHLRRLFEALPHFANSLNLTEFRNTLAHLHYDTRAANATLKSIDKRLFPCLFVDQQNNPKVLLSRNGDNLKLFDGATRKEYTVDLNNLSDSEIAIEKEGRAYFISTDFATQTNKKAQTKKSTNWTGDVLRRFKSTLKQLFAMTFVLNFLALLVPLFIMSIYDQVIPSHSTGTLGYLVAGISLALLCEIGLRTLRARYVAYLGARVENIIANATFQKLLSLPPLMTESSPIGSQVSRLKEFDSIRDLFSSTMVNVFLELPFVFIFIAIIAILGGTLAYIPIVMMGIFALIGMIMLPAMKRNVSNSSRERAKRHSFLVESFSNLRTLKQMAAEKTWLKRYRDMSAETAYNHFRTSQVSLLLQNMAQAIMMGAGVATVGFGVTKILAGDMTIGALIACMALVWRVLSPLQQLFLTLTRFEQTMNSLKQINQLMTLDSEHDPSPTALSHLNFAGHVVMDRISFRYKPDAEPALLGTGFEIQPGEMMAIMGPNAAGKSTILKMLLMMHKPQAGRIMLDGMDIRQINPITLRQSIAYVPQTSHFFHGTIAQNLLLAQPMADQAELEEACEMANVLEEIQNLKDGFNTRIGDQSIQSLPSSFTQRLSLARAYLKKAPILLLDEPAKTLDFAGDRAFMKTLENLKGTCTIIMVSHRPSHLKMADKILVIEDGMVHGIGKPEDIFPGNQEKSA